ncbi:MAG: OmpH family outer membrane protein [Proteobacteria bacterium]|nr:OmpH family outer membrane protein [Pseudomonadota bacterium]
MKKILLAALVSLFVLGFSLAPVRAEEGKPIKIAVVDIQSLLKNSKGAQSIESQLATIRKDFQAEVEKEEKALRDAEKAILEQKDKLSEAEFKAKAGEFQKKVAEGQKKIQERKGKLDKALATAVGKLRGEIVKIVADIGAKDKLDLVVARTDVVIVSKDLDITAKVLERIDAELSSITITVE